MIQLQLSLKDLDNNEGSGGLEIAIPGTVGDPTADPRNPIPIFIEYYEGKLRVLIWNGNQDPEIYRVELLKDKEI